MGTTKPRDNMMISDIRSASSGAGNGKANFHAMPPSDQRSSSPPAPAAAPKGNTAYSPLPAPTRYGAHQRTNVPALTAAIGIAALAFSAVMAGQSMVTKTKIERLNVLSIEAPPPPPPAPEPQPQKLTPPPITLPPTPLPPPVDAPRIEAVVAVHTPPPPAPAPVQNDRPAPNASPSPAAVPSPPAVENAGDMSSSMISATPPRYPSESRRFREQGIVILRLVLGLDGRVSDIRVSKSSCYQRLDQAALTAVRRWRWSPTLRNGAPVIVQGLVEIPFILQEKP